MYCNYHKFEGNIKRKFWKCKNYKNTVAKKYQRYHQKKFRRDKHYQNNTKQMKKCHITTVASLIILPAKISKKICEIFSPNEESALLISIHPRDIIGSDKYKEKIPKEIFNRIKKISSESEIGKSYVHRFLEKIINKKEWVYLREGLLALPDKFELLLQVELPSVCKTDPKEVEKNRYKNIDIGSTSNGKIKKNVDKNHVDTAIRETYEETNIQLDRGMHFNKYYQEIMREKITEDFNLNHDKILKIPVKIYHKNFCLYTLILNNGYEYVN